MRKRGTSNAPLILGIIGAVVSLPSLICAAFIGGLAGLVSTGGSKGMIILVGAIPTVVGFVGAFFGKSNYIVCGISMFVSAVVTLIFLFMTAFTGLFSWAALILFIIAGIIAFVQEKEEIDDHIEEDDEEDIQVNNYLQPNPVLVGLTGIYKDTKIELLHEPIVLGRDPGLCQLVFPDDESDISRKHCMIKYDLERKLFVLEDYSSNGTFLESGERLNKSILYRLTPGSRFYLNNINNLFEVRLDS